MTQSSQSEREGRTSVLPGDDSKTDDSEKALKARARPGALERNITGISSASWPDPGPPPNGGRVAWTQAALLHLSTFNTFGYTTAFGVRASR